LPDESFAMRECGCAVECRSGTELARHDLDTPGHRRWRVPVDRFPNAVGDGLRGSAERTVQDDDVGVYEDDGVGKVPAEGMAEADQGPNHVGFVTFGGVPDVSEGERPVVRRSEFIQ
jgi:hypothetical protein